MSSASPAATAAGSARSIADDAVETEGVNDRVQLAELARVLNARLVRKAQLAGVTVHDPATTWIHADVTIGPDTEILPGTQLQAGTTIGSGCSIGPDTTLIACTVEDEASVVRSHCHGATIGRHASGRPVQLPAAGCRAARRTARPARSSRSRSPRSARGRRCRTCPTSATPRSAPGRNIGAGTITANYDGDHKFPTVIGDHAFVGSDSTLVAPVTIARRRLRRGRLDHHRRPRSRRPRHRPGPAAFRARLGAAQAHRHQVRRRRPQAAIADEPVQLPAGNSPSTTASAQGDRPA